MQRTSRVLIKTNDSDLKTSRIIGTGLEMRKDAVPFPMDMTCCLNWDKDPNVCFLNLIETRQIIYNSLAVWELSVLCV